MLAGDNPYIGTTGITPLVVPIPFNQTHYTHYGPTKPFIPVGSHRRSYLHLRGNIMINITAYVDGSSLGNPGPSGYGAILTNNETGVESEISTPVCHATGNMAEIMAARGAMLACETPSKTRLTIYSDSMYTIGVCSGKKKAKSNYYLVGTVLKVMKEFDKITWIYVRGHNGDVMNNRADKLAKRAAIHARKNRKSYSLSRPKVIGFVHQNN